MRILGNSLSWQAVTGPQKLREFQHPPMRPTSPAIHHVSRAPRQCWLAMLDETVCSHAARRLALCSEDWKRARGTPSTSNAGRRARTPTLMPGRSLTRPCPGTGTPSRVIERRGRRAFRYSARGLPVSTLERLGSSQPVSTLERFHARCRRHNLAANAELALRARTRHRVCPLLSELRPRLAQSSAEPSDRPAAAEGRVCSTARQDPRACARAPRAFGTAHHRGTWLGRRCLTRSLAEAVRRRVSRATHAAQRSQNDAPADCAPIAPVTMLVPARLWLR